MIVWDSGEKKNFPIYRNNNNLSRLFSRGLAELFRLVVAAGKERLSSAAVVNPIPDTWYVQYWLKLDILITLILIAFVFSQYSQKLMCKGLNWTATLCECRIIHLGRILVIFHPPSPTASK